MIHWIQKSIPTLLLTLCICFISQLSYAQDEDEFEVYLQFSHRGVINSFVITYYNGEKFFLPVNEIFSLLQIEAESSGLVISGKYALEQTPYTIDLTRQVILFGDESYPITNDEYIVGDLDIYLPPRIFNEIFGLEFSVDFNNLTLRLVTQKEIPVIAKSLRDQKRRVAAQNRGVQNFYPLEFGRSQKFLDGGFVDYALSANVTPNNNTLSYNTSLGLQLAGGDLQGSIFGNISKETSALESNNLRWRTLIRNNNWLSSVTAGQTVTDGVLMDRYTGIRLSNEPIEPRKLFDEFEVQGITFPQSEVELYLNNALIDFKQADELGNYRFLTPLFYGSSQLDLRIYGPTGQIIQQSSRIQVPFNFIPKGEVNYRLNAGVLDNPIIGTTVRDKTLQGSLSYGVSKWLSTKVGVEYYSDEIGKETPFFTSTLSSRISSNYIFTLEGVTNGYLRSTLNAIYPSSASINIDFINYLNDKSIYNTSGNDQQLVTSVFIPITVVNIPMGFRVSNFSRFRQGINFNSYRADMNARFDKVNFRLGYSDRLIDTINPFEGSGTGIVESSLTYNIARNPNIPQFLRGTFLRSQFRYIPGEGEFQSGEFLFSRNIFRKGRLQLSLGRNFISDFNTIRFNFVIDFQHIRSNTTITSVRNTYTATQNIRGSIGYDSNFNNFLFTSRDQVGRSGAAVRLFVDNNTNGVFDEGDDILPDATMRIGRNGSPATYKNGILYYTLMRPYFRYNMEMNKSSITNPMLVPELDKFSMVTDPNTFKLINIPFNMSGVMEGMVERVYSDGQRQGVAGLKVLLNETGEQEVKELRTFSDGSFYEYPISPGEYKLEVDPSQLNLLQSRSEPEEIIFQVRTLPDGDFVEGLSFSLLPLQTEEEAQEDSLALTIAQVTDEIKSAPEILEFSEDTYRKIDDALRLIIKAQNAFYSKNVDLAFRYVTQSLELFETAQAYALKGSFYYFEGNTEQAQRHWEQALRFNPDLYIPDMETLEERVKRRSSD